MNTINSLDNDALSSLSMTYLDALYEDYLADPCIDLPQDVCRYFALLAQGGGQVEQSHRAVIEQMRRQVAVCPMRSVLGDRALSHICAQVLQWFERHGHYHANIGMQTYSGLHKTPSTFSISDYNITIEEMQTLIPKSFLPQGERKLMLGSWIGYLRSQFQGAIGYEYDQVLCETERTWLRVQALTKTVLSMERQRSIFTQLCCAESFERYLGRQYVGQKRFSLEGSESVIVGLESLVMTSAQHGVVDVVLGMAHRGRLNTMVNILGLPCANIDHWFNVTQAEADTLSGDVKYHLGYSSDRLFGEHAVHLSLNFNPSHLESIIPITMGAVRARQDGCGVEGKRCILPILIHGDASFIGQGVVAEAFNMSYTDAYHIGGVIHIVINNQIGFTTTPDQSRSSYYCTDFAKIISAPVLHVNGDDPEAVHRACEIAAAYRARFHKDIVVDIVAYRRHGHNEADEPRATNPVLYAKLDQRQSVVARYLAILQGVGHDKDDLVASQASIVSRIKSGQRLVAVLAGMRSKRAQLWQDYCADALYTRMDTALSCYKITFLGKQLHCLPKDFVLQKQVALMLKLRQDMFLGQLCFNWGAAESLAFASLLQEGVSIRLVGQDTCRGTFAHRHAVLYDKNTGVYFSPYQKITGKEKTNFAVYNSTLSEFAAMGYEYGYSTSRPDMLVVWEAQFGDFVNSAQVIIDQYLASAWQKWGRMSGLVLLLPHGYEGQGPEHSSARIERYLQLCAQKNIQVCIPSTPAQYFHLLRRQVMQRYRAPLIVFTPKSLLRHPGAVSGRTQFIEHCFTLVLDDMACNKAVISRVVLCSGKVYYDLLGELKKQNLSDIALCRIEQLYPTPKVELTKILAQYRRATRVIWCQEEPYNQGIWSTLQMWIGCCLASWQTVHYVGRDKMASSAPGSYQCYKTQQVWLVRQALGLGDG